MKENTHKHESHAARPEDVQAHGVIQARIPVFDQPLQPAHLLRTAGKSRVRRHNHAWERDTVVQRGRDAAPCCGTPTRVGGLSSDGGETTHLFVMRHLDEPRGLQSEEGERIVEKGVPQTVR